MKISKSFFILLLCYPVQLAGQSLSHSQIDLLDVKKNITRYEYSKDLSKMYELEKRVRSLAFKPEKQWLIDYYLARIHSIISERYTDLREKNAVELSKIYRNPTRYMYPLALEDKKKEKAFEHTKRAELFLKAALKKNASSADVYALLGQVYGRKAIFESVFNTLYLHGKSNEYFEKTLDLDKTNPRVYLLMAVAKYYTPSFLGGGDEAAMVYLKQAEKNFKHQNNQNNNIMPTWGKDLVYQWMGIIAQKRSQYDLAKKLYQKALKINPNNKLIENFLLPTYAIP